MINLTQKERCLLEDQKSHEEMCIKKYGNYAQQSNDSQLKQIFLNNQAQEKEHLDSVNQLLNGQIPNVNQNQQGQQNQQNQQSLENIGNQFSNQEAGLNNANDADLCTDILMTEKYISDTYDTAIFEFRDPQIRQVLNHIQKEEQEHGENVYKYMESKGMYHPQ